MPLKHGWVGWTTNEDADQCKHVGLLPVPWVVSAAGEGGTLTSEAEHGQGDEGLGAVESVCHAGDLPRAFRTADLWLIHAADCCSRYSSWTCCGVRY